MKGWAIKRMFSKLPFGAIRLRQWLSAQRSKFGIVLVPFRISYAVLYGVHINIFTVNCAATIYFFISFLLRHAWITPETRMIQDHNSIIYVAWMQRDKVRLPGLRIRTHKTTVQLKKRQTNKASEQKSNNINSSRNSS